MDSTVRRRVSGIPIANALIPLGSPVSSPTPPPTTGPSPLARSVPVRVGCPAAGPGRRKACHRSRRGPVTAGAGSLGPLGDRTACVRSGRKGPEEERQTCGSVCALSRPTLVGRDSVQMPPVSFF